MAGIMFTDGTKVLAGFNRHTGRITGIGGKIKTGETPCRAAVREAIEELFEFNFIPKELLEQVYSALEFSTIIGSKYYSLFPMSFDKLEKILNLAEHSSARYSLHSKVYDKFPLTIKDLIHDRKIHKHAELEMLMLLPCEIKISSCFKEDIVKFKSIEYIIGNVF